MKTLVIAPHPDDEILGCGGTMLRRRAEGGTLAWLIVTKISLDDGWPEAMIQERKKEVSKIGEFVGFNKIYNLDLPAAKLDTLPIQELVDKFSEVFRDFQPEEVLLPHCSDVHTDHRIVFNAVAACCKWFRYPSVKRVLAYETISETDFGLDQTESFKPNFYIDISPYIDIKMELMSIYQSEMGDFPFPRSARAIRAQASLRGMASGCDSAEAFQLLKEIT